MGREVHSSRLPGEERVTVDLELAGLLFSTRTAESIDRRTDPDINEPDVLKHLLPGCARQTTGNSRRPEIDVADRRFGYGLAIRDVGKLQTAARAQDAEDFGEDRALVGAQVDHAVADDDIGPAVFDRQILCESVTEFDVASPNFVIVARDFASISSVMSTPTTPSDRSDLMRSDEAIETRTRPDVDDALAR